MTNDAVTGDERPANDPRMHGTGGEAMTEDELLGLLNVGLRAAGFHPRIKAQDVLAAVCHDHGERIAQDHDAQADEYERLGYLGEDIYRACAQRARDLSPAPEEKP